VRICRECKQPYSRDAPEAGTLICSDAYRKTRARRHQAEWQRQHPTPWKPIPPAKLICEHCEEPFEGTNDKRVRFCSERCRRLRTRRSVCASCGGACYPGKPKPVSLCRACYLQPGRPRGKRGLVARLVSPRSLTRELLRLRVALDRLVAYSASPTALRASERSRYTWTRHSLPAARSYTLLRG
jgi:hypothetical protein